MPPRDLLIALGVVTVWGLNFVVIKWGVADVPPLLLTALRYVAAVLPAIFFVRRPNVRLGSLLGYGFAIGVVQFGLLFLAIGLGLPAGLASLLIQLQVFFTIGLAALFLGERPGAFQLGGAVLAFAGVALIAAERPSDASNAIGWLPLVLIVLSGAAWGVGNIVSKRAGKVDMLAFVVWASLVPILPLLAASLVFEGMAGFVALPGQLLDPKILAIIAFNGWMATVFGFGMWAVLLARHPAGVLVPFALLVPVVGLAAAWVVAGESLSWVELAGSAVVLGGLAVNSLGARLFGRLRGSQPARSAARGQSSGA